MPLPLIGNHLRVRTEDGASDYYRSRLLEFTEGTYQIEVPLFRGNNQPMQVSDNQTFWVEFNAQDGSLCRFPTRRRRVLTNPVICWEIQQPDVKDVLREQRREFVRVQVDLPVRIAVLSRAEQPVECFTRDISGGGMAFIVPKNYILRPGVVIEAKFTLPNVDFPVNVKGFVIRISDPNEQGFRIASIQFIDMAESIRKKIIQFTFTRQRMSSSES